MADWPEVQLGDLVEIKHGYAFDGRHFSDRPAQDVLVTPGNFAIGGGFKVDKLKYYQGPVPETFVLRGGDLLITMTDLSKAADTLGYPAVVPNGEYRWLHNQRIGKVALREPSGLDARFLYYLLRSRKYRDEVLASATGTTVKHTSPRRIAAFRFRLPPLDEQRTTADILGALDDRIELNRRMNETLEAMARAIFKSWFVGFEPVCAKAAELVRYGMLEIGDGYRAKNSELGATGLPFIRAGNLNDGFDSEGADLLSEASVARAGSKISRVGDVAFTSKGTIGRFARVGEYTSRFVYSPQVCYWRSLDPARMHPAVLYCWMVTDDFKAQIAAVAGQTDMAPYVSLRDQLQMNVPLFAETQDAVACRITPLLVRQSLNTAESRSLATLRDSLLPKLLSGEIRAADS